MRGTLWDFAKTDARTNSAKALPMSSLKAKTGGWLGDLRYDDRH
jgi:hypothetical protein